jgi:hypothetical protein
MDIGSKLKADNVRQQYEVDMECTELLALAKTLKSEWEAE